jgi:hypothetical protein
MARRRKQIIEEIWKNENKTQKVVFGKLEPSGGHQSKGLFLVIGEKLPFECLSKVRQHVRKRIPSREGVYMAHDSFGVPRYGGRGKIFRRLLARQRKYQKELEYFSFYIVADRSHTAELENVILRAAGPQMLLNKLKVRSGSKPGSVRDYNPGTQFYQRKDGQERVRRKSSS